MTERVLRKSAVMPKQPWYRILYIQVIIAIILGVTLGYYYPDAGKALKPLGDGFISLIKMMIAPAIFCTVVHGIASIGDMRKVGRIGGKTLLYFETVSTVALLIGLLVGHYLQPGAGFNIDPATLDPKSVASYVTRAKDESFVSHLLAIIPNSYFDSLAKGDLLQVLLVAVLSGFAISHMGKPGEAIANGIDLAGKMFFRIIGMIVQLAPVGAFGAMAFTIGSFGLGALVNLGYLIFTFYLASLLFVLLVLGGIARVFGFSILRSIGYIKDELLIVLGTSSSETVLPRMITKMEALG
ncbi:MAG: cation:dicarboxylase symporter family transporter, partial [Tardiphaga sp.]|nr:cation:dicarboxylase symporter family transporter [Tardiphaga sp.]